MDRQIIINAVGDVWFGDHPVCVGHGVNSAVKKHGVPFLFEKVNDLFKDGDINFCNLETILSDFNLKKWYLPSKEMRGFPDCGKGLKANHFNLVNIANNHILQHGETAFYDTLRILKDNGIEFIGLDEQFTTNLFTYEKEGLRLGFFGFSLHPEENFRGKVGYSYRSPGKELLEEIKKIRNGFEGILVLSLHWGDEFIHFPRKEQVYLAHEIIDSGVSVILGHHPHVLQGIEKYKDGLIAYSLGNFIFDLCLLEEKTRQSIILKILIDDKGIKDFSSIPIYIGQNYQPMRATEAMVVQILTNLGKYQEWITEKSLKVDKGEYYRVRQNCTKAFRSHSYKYFMKNIRKYSWNMIFQSLARAAFRRIL